MTNYELKKIIEKHEKWLIKLEGGERAVLTGAVFDDDDNKCKVTHWFPFPDVPSSGIPSQQIQFQG